MKYSIKISDYGYISDILFDDEKIDKWFYVPYSGLDRIRPLTFSLNLSRFIK